MNCQQSKMWIAALLDGSLEKQRVREVTRHLKVCPGCDRFHREQLLLTQELGSLNPFPLDPPDRIWTNIQSSLEGPTVGWRYSWERLVEGLRIPRQRYALAGLIILILCSLAVLELPSIPSTAGGDRQLAALAAFGLQVEGNPFLSSIEGQSSFRFDTSTNANPFSEAGGTP